MNFDIFKDALTYPLLNKKYLLLMFFLLIVGNLFFIYPLFINYFIFYDEDFFMRIGLILVILSVIFGIFIFGYCVSIVKNSISSTSEMPKILDRNNVIYSFKHLIVSFVYFLIPTLIFVGLAYMMNLTSYGFDFAYFQFLKTIPVSENEDILMAVSPTFEVLITIIISSVIFLIFSLFEIVAVCRLAEYDSLRESFNFKAVLSKVKNSFLKLFMGILFIILFSLCLGYVFSFFNSLFLFGIFISIIGYTYLIIVNYRFIGLLYSDIRSSQCADYS